MERKLSNTNQITLEADVFKNLMHFKGISTLKKAALNLFVRQAQIESDQVESHETAQMRARAEQLR